MEKYFKKYAHACVRVEGRLMTFPGRVAGPNVQWIRHAQNRKNLVDAPSDLVLVTVLATPDVCTCGRRAVIRDVMECMPVAGLEPDLPFWFVCEGTTTKFYQSTSANAAELAKRAERAEKEECDRVLFETMMRIGEAYYCMT